MHKRLFGLIGYPLSHSFSKKYFTEKFRKEGLTDCEYELFPLPALDGFPSLLATQPFLEGLSVTIPWKKSIIPYLDELSPVAVATGAVNLIRISGKKCKGDNTDVHGFEKSLARFLPDPLPGNLEALVLGTGGASQAVVQVLKKLSIPFRLVSRQSSDNYLSYPEVTPALLAACRLVINTTPLGMYPAVEGYPELPYSAAGEKHFFFDLVYNPAHTLFLKKAKARGAKICNGLEMLHFQAERAWEIWNEDL